MHLEPIVPAVSSLSPLISIFAHHPSRLLVVSMYFKFTETFTGYPLHLMCCPPKLLSHDQSCVALNSSFVVTADKNDDTLATTFVYSLVSTRCLYSTTKNIREWLNQLKESNHCPRL